MEGKNFDRAESKFGKRSRWRQKEDKIQSERTFLFEQYSWFFSILLISVSRSSRHTFGPKIPAFSSSSSFPLLQPDLFTGKRSHVSLFYNTTSLFLPVSLLLSSFALSRFVERNEKKGSRTSKICEA